jgi:sec-independent protein translocase protein TatC
MTVDDARMTLVEHLAELRDRLVRIAVAVLVGFFVAYAFHVEIFAFLSEPVRDALAERGIYKLLSIQVAETLFVYVKASLVATVVCLAPYVFYQLWAFVAPGLLPSERRFILPIAVSSGLFFFLGAAFAYLVLVPFVTGFMADLSLSDPAVELQVTVSSVFTFMFVSVLSFGVAFQLPIAMFFLALLGIANHKLYLKYFRHFIVVAFVIGAIFTPPEPVSQTLLAVPLILLYGVGIGGAVLLAHRKSRESGERSPLTRTRVAAVAVVILGVAAGGGAILWQFRPKPPATHLIPRSATAVAGFSPAHSPLESAPELVARFVLGREDGPLAAALREDGVRSVVAFTSPAGRAVLVEQAEETTAPWGASGLEELEVTQLEERVWAVGPRAAVEEVRRCAKEAEACLDDTPESKGALSQLHSEGPAWLYVPPGGESVGAALPLNDELPTDASSSASLAEGSEGLVVRLRLPGVGASEALRARLASWRESMAMEAETRAQSADSDKHLAAIATALRDLHARQTQLATALRAAGPAQGTPPERWKALDMELGRIAQATVSLPTKPEESGDARATAPASLLEGFAPPSDWRIRAVGNAVEISLDVPPARVGAALAQALRGVSPPD